MFGEYVFGQYYVVNQNAGHGNFLGVEGAVFDNALDLSDDAAAPTLKEIAVGQTQTQQGYSVTVDKVEFAETETRVYVTVNNGGDDNFHLYSFNAKLIQDNVQYEESPNYDADYPEIESDLLPGATSTGVIVFEPLEQKDFKLYIEGYSDDYSVDFEDYTFDIKVQ